MKKVNYYLCIFKIKVVDNKIFVHNNSYKKLEINLFKNFCRIYSINLRHLLLFVGCNNLK